MKKSFITSGFIVYLLQVCFCLLLFRFAFSEKNLGKSKRAIMAPFWDWVKYGSKSLFLLNSVYVILEFT